MVERASSTVLAGTPTRRRVSEAIYGTIVVLSVLFYLAEEHAGAVEATLAVGGGACVLFLARLYSEALAERTAVDDARNLRRIAAENWPVAAIAGPPLVPLTLSALHLLDLNVAIDAATWICVAGLAISGYTAAHLSQATWGRRLLSAASNLAVGLLIVELKAWI